MQPNLKRLRRIVRHLRRGKLAHEKFDFNFVNATPSWTLEKPSRKKRPEGCGTHGCAMGEFPVIWPEHWRWYYHSVTMTGIPDVRLNALGANETCVGLKLLKGFVGVWLGLSEAAVQLLFLPVPTGSNEWNKLLTKCEQDVGIPGAFQCLKHIGESPTRQALAAHIDLFCRVCETERIPRMTAEEEKRTYAKNT